MGEVSKAYERRLAAGWFARYCPDDKSGIDIGCQHDPINYTFRRWDLIFGDGDATYMAGVPNEKFWTVHASHVLEHLDDPVTALRHWYRILKPGGHLIVLVPHRDFYEKQTTLPSLFNEDHKTYWLPEVAEPPVTLSFKHTILEAIPQANIVSFEVLTAGHVPTPPTVHSIGEYSIEAIIQK